jgi:hypothetical protein
VGGGTSKACEGGCGTFFSVSRSGAAHVLYSFKGGRQVAGPANLIVNNGILFGTAPSFCGDCGTAYEISVSGHEELLHRFTGGKSGLYPEGFPLAVEKERMYGITAAGGQYNMGTVFTLSQ